MVRIVIYGEHAEETDGLEMMPVSYTHLEDTEQAVAEGVETEAEMRLLSSWNVDMIL